MPLLKDHKIVDDGWVRVADDIPLPANASPIVSLARWKAEGDALNPNGGPLGILLRSDETVEEIADHLDRFDLIALDFPTFKDGRGYSMARLLRERYGYEGEVRAVGNVLRDQIAFMERCGFNSFEIEKSDDLESSAMATAEISVAYQPTPFGNQIDNVVGAWAY